jgi:putative ABC transport system ATP-binding protein
VHDPILLLADEPTGSLDTETGGQVLALLAELARGGGRAMIVVTHSDAVARAADRILAIRDGRLVEETLPGSPRP